MARQETRRYEQYSGGWAAYLRYLERSLLRKVQMLHIMHGLPCPTGRYVNIADIEALRGLINYTQMNKLRGTLAEILVTDSMLGREEIVAVNRMLMNAEGEHTGEVDAITGKYIVEISAGNLSHKREQFKILAEVAAAEHKELLLYYDPDNARRGNIRKVRQAAKKYGVRLILRRFFWDHGVFNCPDMQDGVSLGKRPLGLVIDKPEDDGVKPGS